MNSPAIDSFKFIVLNNTATFPFNYKNMYRILFVLVCLFLSLFGCKTETTQNNNIARVKIVKTDNQYQLLVNEQPFMAKGAGISFSENSNFKALKEAGGTALRTWSTEFASETLDSAAKYGLMVALGLDIEKELHSFDYENEKAVQHQIARLKKEVDQFKDHPNLLCWVAGNELNLLFDEDGSLKLVNPKTYIALNEVVNYIHEVDPHHPVTTTFAGGMKEHIDLALKHCPNLDFISLQAYGDLGAIPEMVKAAQLTKPFMVTEFGPLGHWERPFTEWGREIEEASAPKAKGYTQRMQQGLTNNESGLNVGYFAFLWGQKQERTPTWYSIFHKTGEATATVDELTKYWTGKYPQNRAPQVDSMKLDGRNAVDNIYLRPASEYRAKVFASEPNQDPMTYKWFVLKEVEERSQGGAKELEPPQVDLKGLTEGKEAVQFISPSATGDYRLFVYVYDGKGKVGNANIPFFVQ